MKVVSDYSALISQKYSMECLYTISTIRYSNFSGELRRLPVLILTWSHLYFGSEMNIRRFIGRVKGGQ